VAAGVVRALRDEDLARSGPLEPGAQPMTLEQLNTGGLLAHIDEQFGSIRQTVGH
jgi:hypothetical protein